MTEWGWIAQEAQAVCSWLVVLVLAVLAGGFIGWVWWWL